MKRDTSAAPSGASGAATAGRQAALGGHRSRVGLICLVAAAAYAVIGLVKLATYRASTFDLVILGQAVRNYAAFSPEETRSRRPPPRPSPRSPRE